MNQSPEIDEVLLLTTNADGASLNLSNFKKVYDYYDTTMFGGELKRLNRKYGFQVPKMYSRKQEDFVVDLAVRIFDDNKAKGTLYGHDYFYFKDNIKQFYPNLIGFSLIEKRTDGTSLIEYFPYESIITQGTMRTQEWDREVRRKLGFQNNTELLKYMVVR